MCMSCSRGDDASPVLWPSFVEKGVGFFFAFYESSFKALQVYEIDGRIRLSGIVSRLGYAIARTQLTQLELFRNRNSSIDLQ